MKDCVELLLYNTSGVEIGRLEIVRLSKKIQALIQSTVIYVF